MEISLKKKLSISEKKQVENLFEECFKTNDEEICLFEEVSIVLMKEGDLVVGMCFLLTGIEKDEIKVFVSKDDTFLYNFCIDSKYRKKGYGKKLLEKCHQFIKTTKVFLFVENNNKPAISLYNKFGYKVTVSMPHGFLMEKKLE